MYVSPERRHKVVYTCERANCELEIAVSPPMGSPNEVKPTLSCLATTTTTLLPSMKEERFEDSSEHRNDDFDNNIDTVARIDDPDLSWSDSEDEEIGHDLDSEDEREQSTRYDGADDEDWELAERGAVSKRERAVPLLPLTLELLLRLHQTV